MSEVEAGGPYTAQITTSAPNPLLWETLLRVRIMSEAWTRSHGVTNPADFRAGEHTYASDHANGTGPFALEEFDRVGGIVMVRNTDWWGAERYPHDIDRIERVMLEDTAEGVQALSDGRIDFLQELPYDWIGQLERAPGTGSYGRRGSIPHASASTKAATSSAPPTSRGRTRSRTGASVRRCSWRLMSRRWPRARGVSSPYLRAC